MQKEGLSEKQIITRLQQEGVALKEINDSMNQARIKNAVSQDTEQENSPYQESISTENLPYPQTNISGDAPQQNYTQQPETAAPYQEYAPDQDYSNYYYQQGIANTETITDIAEQIIAEKNQELAKKIDILTQSKNTFQREIEELKEKVNRIESSLDSIQKAIIGKIGEFGDSTRVIQKDLENIHNTMSKMMNPLIDNYNELKKFNSKK
jgi:DNA-binding transcriptional MerR regulator